MSAPQTNIEKQERRHKGPLIGIVVAAIVALIGLAVWTGVFESDQPDPVGTGGTEQAAPSVDQDAGATAD